MPYAIIIRRTGAGTKYCVIRKRTGNRPQETKKCHDDEAAAEKHLAALRIAESKEG